MPRFGQYVTVRQLGESPSGTRVWSARHADDPANAAPRFAVKVFAPPPFGAGDPAQLVADFLAGAKLQSSLSGAGDGGPGGEETVFAPVHAMGRLGGDQEGDAGSAWFVTDLFMAPDGKSIGSLRQYMLARATDLAEHELAAIMLGPVRAAAQIEAAGGSHGNLDASNIFVRDWRGLARGRGRVVVTDPAPPRPGEEPDPGVDRRALALLLSRLVSGDRSGASRGPAGVAEGGDKWSAAGRDGEYWQALRKELSSLSGGGRSLSEIADELSARAVPKKRTGRVLVLAGAALVVLALIGGGVWFLAQGGGGAGGGGQQAAGAAGLDGSAAAALGSSDKSFGDPPGEGGSEPWCTGGALREAWTKSVQAQDPAVRADAERLSALVEEVKRSLEGWAVAREAAGAIERLRKAGIDPQAVGGPKLSELVRASAEWSAQVASPTRSGDADGPGLASAGVKLHRAWRAAGSDVSKAGESAEATAKSLESLSGAAPALAGAIGPRVATMLLGAADVPGLTERLRKVELELGRLGAGVAAQPEGPRRAALIARAAERAAQLNDTAGLTQLADGVSGGVAKESDPALWARAGAAGGSPRELVDRLTARLGAARAPKPDDDQIDPGDKAAAERSLSEAEAALAEALALVDGAEGLPRVALFEAELRAVVGRVSSKLEQASLGVNAAEDRLAAGRWQRQKEQLAVKAAGLGDLWPEAVKAAAVQRVAGIESADGVKAVAELLKPLDAGGAGGAELQAARALARGQPSAGATAQEHAEAQRAWQNADEQLAQKLRTEDAAGIRAHVETTLTPAARAFKEWAELARSLDEKLSADEKRAATGRSPDEPGWAWPEVGALRPAIASLSARAAALSNWRDSTGRLAESVGSLDAATLAAAARTAMPPGPGGAGMQLGTLRACVAKAVAALSVPRSATLSAAQVTGVMDLLTATVRVRRNLGEAQPSLVLAPAVGEPLLRGVWLELLRDQAAAADRAASVAGVRAVLARRNDFGVLPGDRELPAWVAWCESVADVADWSTSLDDAGARRQLERLLATGKPAALDGGTTPGVSEAVEAAGRIEAALKEQAPTVRAINPAELGPAKSPAQWRYDAEASAALATRLSLPSGSAAVYVPSSGGAAPGTRLEFVLVETGAGRVFLSRHEVSIGVFKAVADRAWSEITRGEQGLFSGGRAADISKEAIARAWEFVDEKVPPTGLRDRGGSWMVLGRSAEANVAGLGPRAEQLNPPLPEASQRVSLPMTLVPLGVAERAAAWLGCELPRSSAYAAGLAADGGAAALNGRRWNLRGAGWEAAMAALADPRFNQVSAISLKTDLPRPGRGRLGDINDSGVAQIREAERGVWPASVTPAQPTLFFVPVDDGGTAKFPHIVGNVAEYVKDGAGVSVFGGSVLSAPEPDGLPVATPPRFRALADNDRSDAEGQGFTDVGFRLSFVASESVAGPAPLAQRVAVAVASLRPLAPSAPVDLRGLIAPAP